tara:strand:- start:264 stop:500 length:237 start_codon:yes stop_codon:yes gene_type:complete
MPTYAVLPKKNGKRPVEYKELVERGFDPWACTIHTNDTHVLIFDNLFAKDMRSGSSITIEGQTFSFETSPWTPVMSRL